MRPPQGHGPGRNRLIQFDQCKGPSLNNRFDMPVRILLVRRIADTQDPPIWIGYSGSDPKRGKSVGTAADQAGRVLALT